MSFAAERTSIEARFATEWAATDHSTVPVAYENVDFSPPLEADPWVAIYIRNGAADVITIGPSVTRTGGLIQVSVYAPASEGTHEAREIADSAAGVFNIVQFTCGADVITTGPAYLSSRGTSDGYHQLDVTIPFQRDTFN